MSHRKTVKEWRAEIEELNYKCTKLENELYASNKALQTEIEQHQKARKAILASMEYRKNMTFWEKLKGLFR